MSFAINPIFIPDKFFFTMPRSNKKKHVVQRAVPTGDGTVALLLSKERNLMINGAVVSYSIKSFRKG